MGGGQSFLVEPRWLTKALEAARCCSDEVVFVVGGGNGQLASLLSDTCRVMLVEPDEYISRYLYTLELYHTMVINAQPHLVLADVPFDKIISLQPGLIEADFLQNMLRVDFKHAVIMLPDDVISRFRARDRLGVLLRARYDMKQGTRVPMNVFSPPLSSPAHLVELKPKEEPDLVAQSVQLLVRESGTMRGLLTRSCREFFGYTLAEAQEAVRMLDPLMLRKRFWDLSEDEFSTVFKWLKLG